MTSYNAAVRLAGRLGLVPLLPSSAARLDDMCYAWEQALAVPTEARLLALASNPPPGVDADRWRDGLLAQLVLTAYYVAAQQVGEDDGAAEGLLLGTVERLLGQGLVTADAPALRVLLREVGKAVTAR